MLAMYLIAIILTIILGIYLGNYFKNQKLFLNLILLSLVPGVNVIQLLIYVIMIITILIIKDKDTS